MKEKVVLKGTKSGIILVLDENTDFETLKAAVAEKFEKSADFLGKADKAILFKGKELNDEQKLEIIEIIHENCQLSIICIMDEDADLDQAFQNSIQKRALVEDASTGQFYKGNLRSGQVLDVETSIIIMGDVNAGAKVISKGNVIILGSLKGNVYAGAGGNVDAFVVALDMEPVQIRIADTIARAPDHPQKKKIKETKIAYWDSDNIYIEPLDKDVLGDIRL